MADEKTQIVEEDRNTLLHQLQSEMTGGLLRNARPEEALAEFLPRILDVLGLEIHLHDAVADENGLMRLASASGLPERLVNEGNAPAWAQAISRRAARQESPAILEDAAADPELAATNLEAEGVKAYACFPLLARGKLLGTLAFGSRRRTGWPREDLALLESISRQAALALDWARTNRLLEQRTEELAEAERRKDEFLSMLAHQLRNPLSPIMCAMEVMRLSGIGNPSQERSMDVVERQAQHMARLLDDLLDVSRLRRGKIELRKEAVELTVLVEQAVEAVQPFVESRKHKLSIEMPPQSIWLEIDPARMEQALTNLLDNAAKYTGPGGEIGIAAEREGQEAVIRIKDSGLGIPPEKLGSIFELFNPADHPAEHAGEGLGLGLMLVRRLIELHGGNLDIASPGPGKGTEVTIRLPILTRAPWMSEERERDAITLERSRRRILIVEDNVDSAKSLAELLELWGHEVRIAYDGPVAIAEAEREPPDVVLLDIGLPGMNGYQVTQALRERPGLDKMLIVAVTGYGQSEDKELSKVAGIDHHITKPIDFAMLEELLA